MNIEDIEELIRRYLSTGIAVVVILVAPGTGVTDSTPGASPADPSVTVIEPDGSQRAERPLPDRPGDEEQHAIPPPEPREDPAPLDEPPPAGTDDRTGAGGADPGSDPGEAVEAGGTGPGDSRGSDTGDVDDGAGSDTSEDCNCVDRLGGGDADSQTDERPNPAAPRDQPDPDRYDSDRSGNQFENNRSGDPSGTEPGDNRSDSNQRDGDRPHSDQPHSDQPHSDQPHSDQPHSDQPEAGAPDAGQVDAGSAETGSAEGTTAAERYGWGTPNRVDDFSGGAEQWDIYDGPGHAGKGIRSPSAVSLDNGILTITGDSSGTTAGMAWNPGQKYGRWEGRVRAPASDPSYNALLLLWPDAENFPVGGEIDFMEMLDHTRQETDLFLHHGADNSQVNGKVQIDGTQWHNWAVEWTPDAITAYVDGEEWYRTTDTSIFPPGPMHLCIQLDWFPEGDNPTESTMHVDWVKQYSLDGSGGSDSSGSDGDGDGDTATGTEPGDDEAGSEDSGDSGEEQEDASPVRELVRRMFSWR